MEVGDGCRAIEVEFVLPRAAVARGVALDGSDAGELVLYRDALAELSPAGLRRLPGSQGNEQVLCWVKGGATLRRGRALGLELAPPAVDPLGGLSGSAF